MTLARPHKVSSFCVGVLTAGAAYLSTKVTQLSLLASLRMLLPAYIASVLFNTGLLQHMVWSRVASSQQHRGARQSEVPQVYFPSFAYTCLPAMFTSQHGLWHQQSAPVWLSDLWS